MAIVIAAPKSRRPEARNERQQGEEDGLHIETWTTDREIHRRRFPKSFPSGHQGGHLSHLKHWMSVRCRQRREESDGRSVSGEDGGCEDEGEGESDGIHGRAGTGWGGLQAHFSTGKGADERNLGVGIWPSISCSSFAQEHQCQEFPPSRDLASIMAAAQFLKHGRKVSFLSPPISRAHTRTRL